MKEIKNSYVYDKLNNDPAAHPIRLLRLHPALSFAKDIRCKLFNTTLDAKEDSEALSCTWGDPTETLTITLQGQRHLVTKNLESALRHVRYNDRQRTLWVDALCINQDDTDEIIQQTMQMQGIYTVGGARRVLVWLGIVPDVDRALAFCAKVKE